MGRQTKKATFRFYEELNRFLPTEKRKKDVPFSWTGLCRLGKALEKLGVPSDEVDLVIINQKSASLDYILQDND